ncbi:pol polyprotein [Nephila pilipes]|uniref:Pol polyprotein n=1 Tax=Nephila pilipes TaxID=299642 RepID=A0A8X6QPS0_NEPPI|nr:pol polyprotein [Nephila pilipes]
MTDAFSSNWIARFSVPSTITTVQGSQFESCLFRALIRLLGEKRIHTTVHHSQSNGLIEEFHRPLKAAIISYATEKWTKFLPTILLGLRPSLKETIGCTSAELVYEKILR